MDKLRVLEAINFLDALSREMIEQETDCQADPRFWVVAENKREYGIADGYGDGAVVCGPDGVTFDTVSEFVEYLIESDHLSEGDYDGGTGMSFEDILSDLDDSQFYISNYRDMRDQIAPNTMFLTKQECKKHIECNHYHYTQPHTYAMTAWRSPQVERLYRTLKETDWGQLKELLNRRHSPKPEALTLERLREMAKEPLKHWVWIENFKSPENSGYMRTHSDWSEGEYFCCGWPGVSYSFEYTDYGKTWLAYTTRPETEGD